MRLRSMVKSSLIAFACCVSIAVHAIAQERKPINIPPGDLITALQALSRQSGVEIVYRSEQLEGLKTKGVEGKLAPEEAVAKLLEGTPLQLRTDPASGAMLISVRAPYQPLSQRTDESGPAVSEAGESLRLEEIVVTAQKREERLADVPVPVSVMQAETLVDTNQLSILDYYSSIPGMSLTVDNLRGQPTIAIRGLSLNGASPTVGVVVDDVPYGSSTSLGGGLWIPDIDPSDLSRVEVLRGPQGTLYGASSVGGLMKYVTQDPTSDRLKGTVQVGTDSIDNAGQLGYSARGSVNLPVNDFLAVRMSGFTRLDPGYIDNTQKGAKNVNKTEAQGAFLSALLRITPTWSFKVSALYQDSKRFGSSDADDALGNLQQNRLLDTGQYDRKAEVYSGTVKGRIADVEVTSITAYAKNRLTDSFDYTSIFGPYTRDGIPGTDFTGFGVPGTALFEHSNTDKLTQELRLSGALAQRVDWFVGGFYTYEKSPHTQDLEAVDPGSGRLAGQWLYEEIHMTYEEFAGFADLTLHFTDQFDVQVGARESRDRQTYTETDTGIYLPLFAAEATPNIFPLQSSTDSSFTYLVTPRLRLSTDLMAYARFASGYQPGGPNPGAPPGVPANFGPSKSRDYEIGVKGDFFNHAVSLDSSIYYIQLSDVQLTLTGADQFGYLANGGRARSQGMEVSATSRPLRGLSLTTWVSFNDAELTEAFPAISTAYGAPGDPLPFSSRFSASMSVEQRLPLSRALTGFIGADLSYVGHREGQFQQAASADAAPARQHYPGYAKTNLHAGLQMDSWKVNLFATNIANKRGILVAGLDTLPQTAYSYIPPRTVGLSFSKQFY